MSWVNEGIQHGERGELGTALRFLAACTRRYPDYADGWYNLAVTQLYLGKLDACEQSLRHALSIEPQLVQGHYLNGMLLLVRGDVARAVGEWQRVGQLASDHLFGQTVPGLVRQAAQATSPNRATAIAAGILARVPIGYFYYR